MTQPSWTPSPNPGGQNRRLIRTVLCDWLTAARIAGVDHVYPGEPTEWQFDAFKRSGAMMGCLVGIIVNSIAEGREAYTGPVDPGGKLARYSVTLTVRHVVYQTDAGDAGMGGEDDRDRIHDALKDALRGVGRDLGRPEIVLTAGEWPREESITEEFDGPVVEDGGIVRRDSSVNFTVTQYLRPTEPTP